MKKVLIITYYWFPSGGSGVQRWIKFVKYLREFGWEPIVYAPENPEYPSEDHSFEKDIPKDLTVLKTPIWEPYDIYRNLTGKKGQKINAGFISENKKSGWKEKLFIWIRGNFLIPDPRRFWIKPSIQYLSKFLQENKVDVVVTTGPPHSMHMIGLGLKKKNPQLKWIADFRDPWTKIYYFKDMMLTKPVNSYHNYLEKKVLRSADKVIVVSDTMKSELNEFTKSEPIVITNGYDKDDVELSESIELDEKFSISYIGLLTPNQNPSKLWEILKELTFENQKFKVDLQIQLIGKIDISAFDEIKEKGLENNLIFKNYIPHQDAIRAQQTSQLLLLLLTKDKETAKGILTGKFFEYLASGRPILAIGTEESDVAKILKETNSGKIVGFEDKMKMKRIIIEYYEQFKQGKLVADTKSIDKYSRKELTKQLVGLLEASKSPKGELL